MRHALLLCGLMLCGCAVELSDGPSPEERVAAAELLDAGVAALQTGRFDRAEACFELAEESAPSAEGADGLGAVAFLEGRLEEAERYFRQAFDLGYSPAAWHLAMVAEAQGRPEEAELRYREARRRAPRDGRLRNNFAVLLLERGKVDDARRELLRADVLEEDPLIESNQIEAARAAQKYE